MNLQLFIRRNVMKLSFLFAMTLFALAAYIYHGKNEENLQQNMNQLRSEQNRFKSLNDKKVAAEEYRQHYEKLMPITRFSEEDRLTWLDTLNKVRRNLKLQQLQYNITPRTKYDYKDGVLDNSGLNVHVSDMELNIQMLHEGDLLQVINSLNSGTENLNLLKSCSLTRKNDRSEIKLDKRISNVSAKCKLRWFSLDTKT